MKIIMFVWVLFLSAASLSQEILVVCDEWPPYSYKDGNIIKGSSTDLVKQAFDRSGLDYKLEMFSWARAYQYALNIENTCIYTIVRTEEREGLFQWVGKIQPDNTSYAWTLRANKHVTINSMQDLMRMEVGVHRDSMDHQFLQSIGHKKLQAVTLLTQNILKLEAGRMDAIIATEQNMRENLRALAKHEDLFQRTIAVRSNALYLACQKDLQPELYNKLQQALEDVKLEGQF